MTSAGPSLLSAVLVLFLNQVLRFSESDSTILYHAFTAVCYFTPVFGAVLADSFFGKYRTIFYVSIVYAVGQVVLTIGAVGDSEEGIPGLPAASVTFAHFWQTSSYKDHRSSRICNTFCMTMDLMHYGYKFLSIIFLSLSLLLFWASRPVSCPSWGCS